MNEQNQAIGVLALFIPRADNTLLIFTQFVFHELFTVNILETVN